jgi:hypothetical protein
VCAFTVEIDGVVHKGLVEETEVARAAFDTARAQGKSAQLLEQTDDDLFRILVGNLAANQSCLVTLVYVCDVPVEGNAVRFMVPTFVAPRYDPYGGTSVGTGPVAVPGGVRISVAATMSVPISGVTCPTHNVAVQHAAGSCNAIVTLADKCTQLDRTFDVLFERTDAHAACVVLEQHPTLGTTAAMVSFVPKCARGPVRCELTFLVDASGSMANNGGMKQAREALQIFLRSLPASCMFNVVAFGTSHRSLFPTPQPFLDRTLAAASTFVDELKANMGGTELVAPLKHVLAAPRGDGYARRVFVLTDGQVTNTQDVIDVVTAAGDATVYAIGLGACASVHLVTGIARAGRGTSAFATGDDNGRLAELVVGQLECALQPELSNVTVEWRGSSTAATLLTATFESSGISAPCQVPPLHTGVRFVRYTMFPADAVLPTSVVVSGTTPSGPLQLELQVPAHRCSDTVVHTMAARAVIRDLQSGVGCEHRASTDIRRQIVQIAQTHGLVSLHTSYVSVQPGCVTLPSPAESRAAAAAENSAMPRKCMSPSNTTWAQPQTLVSPVPPLKGASNGAPLSSMMLSVVTSRDTALSRSSTAAPPSCMKSKSAAASPLTKGGVLPPLSFGDAASPLKSAPRAELPMARQQQRANDLLGVELPMTTATAQGLINQQRANGSWTDLFAVAPMVGVDIALVRTYLPLMSDDQAATVLAVAFLRARHPQQCRMMLQKAQAWLATHAIDVDEVLATFSFI